MVFNIGARQQGSVGLVASHLRRISVREVGRMILSNLGCMTDLERDEFKAVVGRQSAIMTQRSIIQLT